MFELWVELTVTPLMLILCVQDMREREMDGRLLALMCLCGAGEMLMTPGTPRRLLAALLPGILLLLFSFLTREALGEGDALLFWALGYCADVTEVARICVESFLLAGLAGLLWWSAGYVSGVRRGKERMAFLPFLTAVWCLELITQSA